MQLYPTPDSTVRVMYWTVEGGVGSLGDGVGGSCLSPSRAHQSRLTFPSSAMASSEQFGPPSAEAHVLKTKLPDRDRKSTRLNSSHVAISYAVFCLKKKTQMRWKGD